MAYLTIYVDDGDVPRIREAFEHRFGPKPEETPLDEWIRSMIQARINSFVRDMEQAKASEMALADFIDINWTEPPPSP